VKELLQVYYLFTVCVLMAVTNNNDGFVGVLFRVNTGGGGGREKLNPQLQVNRGGFGSSDPPATGRNPKASQKREGAKGIQIGCAVPFPGWS
jgi:hypothetical protein